MAMAVDLPEVVVDPARFGSGQPHGDEGVLEEPLQGKSLGVGVGHPEFSRVAARVMGEGIDRPDNPYSASGHRASSGFRAAAGGARTGRARRNGEEKRRRHQGSRGFTPWTKPSPAGIIPLGEERP
jgi:hypothetical protein